MNQNINLLFVAYFYVLLLKYAEVQPMANWTIIDITAGMGIPLVVLIMIDMAQKNTDTNEK